jgi:hypothetical protein
LDEALATFGGLGARVVEVDLPDQTAISAAALLTRARRRLWSASPQSSPRSNVFAKVKSGE